MSECGACQNYCGDCEEEIERLRAELAEARWEAELAAQTGRWLIQGYVDALVVERSAITRVRELCENAIDPNGFGARRPLDPLEVLRALDGAE